MTKTLTKQWKDGKLPVGSYYINLIGSVERVDFFEGLEWERTKDFGIEEVLAPVPSYDECNELAQKIHILNEANMKLENELGQFAEASKTIERLKEQLNEANEVIKKYSDGSIYLFPTWYNGSFEANKYLEKWGVKWK